MEVGYSFKLTKKALVLERQTVRCDLMRVDSSEAKRIIWRGRPTVYYAGIPKLCLVQRHLDGELFCRVLEQARNINLELNNGWNRATLTCGDSTKGYLRHQGRSRKKREIREVGGKLLLVYVQLRWKLESRSVKSGCKHSGCLYMALFFLATCNGKKKCMSGYNGTTVPFFLCLEVNLWFSQIQTFLSYMFSFVMRT